MADKAVMKVLAGEKLTVPPVWLMRQAGRYLPEYRETRKKAGSFLNLCYTPEMAIEVTMQPIRRFGFDASILFSDILVVPDALGRSVRFEEGRGPILEPIGADEISALSGEQAMDHLKPVFETVSGLRSELPADTTLLGFCGAPWTVATYMIAGHGTPDQAPARLFAYAHETEMTALLNLIADVSAQYLIRQIENGADAVQIFDSWSGVLSESEFDKWCIKPMKRLVDGVRAAKPDARIIGFPKGAGLLYRGYKDKTGVDALSFDWTMPGELGRELQATCPVQGNLDPLLVIAGGDALDRGVDTVLETYGDGPHIFNLGHGITPQAPVAHVEQLLKRIRG